MPDEFDQAVQATAADSDDIEREDNLLRVLEFDLVKAKDELALLEAEVRLAAPLTGKNAEDREAELLLRLHRNERWQQHRDGVYQANANVETQRAKLERTKHRRQEHLWIMRRETNLDRGPIDEL